MGDVVGRESRAHLCRNSAAGSGTGGAAVNDARRNSEERGARCEPPSHAEQLAQGSSPMTERTGGP
jgi:hypothetical protein